MRVTLRQLQVFDAVARFNSINKAAEEIALSASAVSFAIKELELNLGAELFERHKRTLILNDNGRRLQPRARTILNQVEELEGKLTDAALSGSLRIAAGSNVGNYVLPRLSAEFLRERPGVHIKLIACSSAEAVERVETMRQDVAFIEGNVNRPHLKLIPWMEDELVVFCSSRHRLAGQTVEPAELAAERWFIQQMGSFTRYMTAAATALHINQLEVGLESNSIEAIKRAVVNGDGIGCLSPFAIGGELRRGDLAIISVPMMPIVRSIKIAVKKEVYRGEVIESFIDYCLQFTREALLDAPD